ncbi:abasic site processing protein HMCES-like isoform X2 [Actinia tenebrosa]|nr:abasic site processing protein HMCES-like isoform X2 [Actinia tenebrosa]
MCGRTACTLNPDEIPKYCRYRSKSGKLQTPQWKKTSSASYFPSYNIAPQACTPVLISSKHVPKTRNKEDADDLPERSLQAMRWGLVPSWYKGGLKEFSLSTNNARKDSLTEKASFKTPLMKGRRCVVLADGFFEWKSENAGKKQPYFIYFKKEDQKPISSDQDVPREDNKRLLTMAGVFDCWKPQGVSDADDDNLVYSYAIITVDASSSLNWLHHRMPAILDGDEAVQQWLDYGSIPYTKAINLLKSVTDCLEWHPVTTQMNNSRYKEPDCIKPLTL